ncbi:maestro heat-like repeat-containing protein family member 1 [Eulemur rufifrons]|uniref:maestro heat-like repeat-containing protein family member 1 n=1 Tax=Eulemur rufifrons TaxID=859984 RepID=UPI0037421DCC
MESCTRHLETACSAARDAARSRAWHRETSAAMGTSFSFKCCAATVGPPSPVEVYPKSSRRDSAWCVPTAPRNTFEGSLQRAGKVFAEDMLGTLKALKIKIKNKELARGRCQMVADIIILYLKRMKPQGELEDACTSLLLALGYQSIEMIIHMLFYDIEADRMPPRSLLLALEQLSVRPGIDRYRDGMWDRILSLLRKSDEEKDMMLLCQVLHGVATGAQVVLDDIFLQEGEMHGVFIKVATKADKTLQVFFHHQPLASKSKVAEKALETTGHLFYLLQHSEHERLVHSLTGWLTMLTTTPVRPLYICKCLCRVLEAVHRSEDGGPRVQSRAAELAGILMKQMSDKKSQPPALCEETQSLALRAFKLLSQLCMDSTVNLLNKSIKSEDDSTVLSALEAFREVVRGAPQAERLKREVLASVTTVAQKDRRPVHVALLRFLEALGQCDYLSLPGGSIIINYSLKLSKWDSSNKADIRPMCSKVLQTVSLPKLISLLCEPSNTSAFVVLSDSAREVALREQALGQHPHLSSFHQRPSEFVSPQQLLSHLVLCAVKPYRENAFGVSSLRLLHTLRPVTTLHLVVNADVDRLWSKELPQMLRMLYEHTEKSLDQDEWEERLLQFSSQSLVAINDDSWLEQLTVTTLERINNGSDEEEQKAFLYKFFAFTLRTSRSPDLVQRMLSAMLNTSHEEPQEREGIAVALAIVSLRHLRVALDQLEVYGANLTDKDRSWILTLTKEHQQREWGLVCGTIYLSYRKIISVTKDALSIHLDSILALAVEHYGHCIVKKDMTLTLDYLDALTQMTSILSGQPMPLSCKVPHKLDLVDSMAPAHWKALKVSGLTFL